MEFTDEIKRRRTFAIISHPDAGKTTLTEKLLLFGGAIHVAGAVKSNKIDKKATSDFMEIEKQRGISVATSVMGFEYDGYKINILDTPGHKDFAEDTYRTLTAVDSVIIVVDVAKGVEEQTRKLMEVCRMRKTPVIIFVNKLDRPGQDAFDLLDELENELQISVKPLSWPIGMGKEFKGVYNLYKKNLVLYTENKKQEIGESIKFEDISSPQLENIIGDSSDILREEVEIVNEVYPEFNLDNYRNGDLAPVFFGSALNNFGVKELLECFIDVAPYPTPSKTEERTIEPFSGSFSGFIFKIHANMDPNHRNRLAFLKICSGKFERNKPYLHVKDNKKIKFSSPTAFMADKKNVIDEAFPGDIVGIPDTGNLKIGDTLTGGDKFTFQGIPTFSPELFRYVENADPNKYKQLDKGLIQLTDEGVAQLFTQKANKRKIIGTVGALQFDVIKYRLEHEYGATCKYENLPMHKACWFESDNKEQLDDFIKRKYQNICEDKHGNLVFMATSSYELQMAQERFKDITFSFTSEF